METIGKAQKDLKPRLFCRLGKSTMIVCLMLRFSKNLLWKMRVSMSAAFKMWHVTARLLPAMMLRGFCLPKASLGFTFSSCLSGAPLV